MISESNGESFSKYISTGQNNGRKNWRDNMDGFQGQRVDVKTV